MKPISAIPLTLPPYLALRLPAEQTDAITSVGNTALLEQPLLALIASRACPARAFIETLELVPGWAGQGAQTGRVLISGFHSPLEQQVLQSLLRRKGRAVKVLACGIPAGIGYRPTGPAEEAETEALAQNRLLVLTPFAPAITRPTRETAMQRNQFALALAAEVCAPHIEDGSPLTGMLAERLAPLPPHPHAEP
jgi:predicted Rossmann fold nucleotide-binding protein DprA/Smf involved in DNA uptake